MRGRVARAALVLFPLALAPIAAASAQERPEPQLLLSLFGGITSGLSLWDINRQPFSRRSDVTALDTFRLERRLESSLTLGANATYFPRPHLGFTGEIVFLGFSIDDDCEVIYRHPSLANPGENDELCGDVARRGGSAATFGFLGGAIVRFSPRGFASPYVALQVGVTTRAGSTVEMQGGFLLRNVPQNRLVLDDPGGSSFNPAAVVGAGVMVPVAPGYQVRLELRDHVLLMDRAAGVAGPDLIPPVESTLVHSLALVVKLDVVLEQKRGRRY